MKRILLLSCTLMLVAIDALAQSGVPAKQPGAWKRYTVRGEEFSVLLPALPTMTTRKKLVLQLGKHRLDRMLGAYAGGLVFTVSCFENSRPRQSLEEFMEQEIFERTEWDRASEQDVQRDGVQGKQYRATTKNPAAMQIFSTGSHFYRFIVAGATADDERVKQFFESVMLGKKTQGIPVSDGIGVPYEPEVAPEDNAFVFTIRDVDRRPVLVMRPEPGYTEEARQHAETGSVILKVVFSANGNVIDIRVASPLRYGLTEKAIEAAKKLKFIPAVKDGKFVSVWTQLEYNFNLY